MQNYVHKFIILKVDTYVGKFFYFFVSFIFTCFSSFLFFFQVFYWVYLKALPIKCCYSRYKMFFFFWAHFLRFLFVLYVCIYSLVVVIRKCSYVILTRRKIYFDIKIFFTMKIATKEKKTFSFSLYLNIRLDRKKYDRYTTLPLYYIFVTTNLN